MFSKIKKKKKREGGASELARSSPVSTYRWGKVSAENDISTRKFLMSSEETRGFNLTDRQGIRSTQISDPRWTITAHAPDNISYSGPSTTNLWGKDSVLGGLRAPLKWSQHRPSLQSFCSSNFRPASNPDREVTATGKMGSSETHLAQALAPRSPYQPPTKMKTAWGKRWILFLSNPALLPKSWGILCRDAPTQGHHFKIATGNCFT